MNKTIRKVLNGFFIMLFAAIFLLPAFGAENKEKPILPSQIGQVLSVETLGNISPSASEDLKQIKQSVDVKVLTGHHKGEKFIIYNTLMGNPAYDINLKPGTKVILHAEMDHGAEVFFIEDIYRGSGMYFLAGLFALLLIVVGKKQGFLSLISILTVLALVFWALTPLILSGFNPFFAAILVCMLASVISVYLVGGLNAKSTAAILGIVLSLAIAGVLAILTIKISSLTGYSSEQYLYLFSAHPDLDFHSVLAAAIIIGALGAVMDIGMSVASTINELLCSNPDMTLHDLFESGMNVGKDVLGMMSNTLILAYMGGSLGLVLLSSNIDLQKFFNLNQVATEICTALIGSIAIVICVPITAVIGAYLIKRGAVKK